MLSKKLKYLTMSAVLLSTLTAALICYDAYSNRPSGHVSVSQDGTTVKELAMEVSDISPGMVRKFDVSLDIDTGFTLSVSFRGDGKESPLNEFLTVSVTTSEMSATWNLKDVLDQPEIILGDDIRNLTFSYMLSLDADNSTQDRSTSFHVDLVTRSR